MKILQLGKRQYSILTTFLLVLMTISTAQFVCPKESDYNRLCTCEENNEYAGTITLTCRSGDDKKISDILNTFLWTAGVSPLSRLTLEQTEITRVPDQVKLFDQLKCVELVGNQIPIIHSRSFVNSRQGIRNEDKFVVILKNNAIRRVEPSAFQGGLFSIDLSNNELTGLPANAFRSVLNRMAQRGEQSFDISGNAIDCARNPCHLSWLVRDDQYVLEEFVSGAMCSNGTRFDELDLNDCASTKYVPIQGEVIPPRVIFPDKKSIAPCTITKSESDPSLTRLDCGKKGLDDDIISRILDAYLNTPGVNPLGELSLWNNHLTRVPHQLPYFNQLTLVDLDSNDISSIPPGTFIYNPVSKIELNRNQLTRIDSKVFLPILEQMGNSDYDAASISIKENPVDCETDLCHLLWIVRDHRHLLMTYLNGGKCANGTALKRLQEQGFNHCIYGSELSEPAITVEADAETDQFSSPSAEFEEEPKEFFCPSDELITPCECKENENILGTLHLVCNDKKLDDAKIDQILDTFLKTPDTSLLTWVSLKSNQLTRAPKKLPLLNFRNGTKISMEDNKLTKLDASSFQPILERMAPYNHPTSYIDLSDNAIDCESDPCHLMWLGRNYRHLFKTIYGARCLNGYPISSLEREQFDFCIEKSNESSLETDNNWFYRHAILPDPIAIWPCYCDLRNDGNLDLNCQGKNLGDLRLSDILDAFIETPGVRALGSVNLQGNNLTRIPNQLSLFHRLQALILANNNISYIQPGAIFSGNTKGNMGEESLVLNLNGNKLTRLEEHVFRPVLEQLASFSDDPADDNERIVLPIGENPIDCETDPCHLAWLLRDNRYLLSSFSDAKCSNGTELKKVDRRMFGHCRTNENK